MICMSWIFCALFPTHREIARWATVFSSHWPEDEVGVHFLHCHIFFGHLRHVRQQGMVLCLGPIAAGWSDSTLSGLFQTQINHFLITFYSVSLTLSFSLSFSVTFSLSHQFERFDIATSFEISAKTRIVGHLKARCHDGWFGRL